jgi:phage repressor protein C with HTH and peptisase S24 domain
MNIQEQISQRFLVLYFDLKNNGIIKSDKALAEKIGYSPQKLNEVLKGRTKFNLDFLQKFCTAYNQSLDFLVFGILNEKTPEWLRKEVKEDTEIYKLKTDKIVNGDQYIPLYDIEAVAGLAPLFQDVDELDPIDHISIPNLPKCDGAIKVTGDSMYPLLKSGDIIIYKKIHDIENDIFWGEMYLLSISTDDEEYITVKYVQRSEKGEDWVKLVSQNQHHQDRDILRSRIKALAFVKASIRINSMS